MAQDRPPPRGAPAGPGAGGPPLSVFGPTERPNEPMTAGLPWGPGVGPQRNTSDADVLLRVLVSILPHPELFRLQATGNDPLVGGSA